MAISSYISFAGTEQSYGEIPIEVLGGASVFTIEAKIATTATEKRNLYYSWGTIIGRELSGTWKNDFSFCINDGKLCFWSQPTNGGSSSSYRTYSEAIVNDGAIHKVAVVSNSDGSIDLYCDGSNVAHTDNVNAKITDAATILVAYNTNSNSPLAMDLYELRLWNTARSSDEIFSKITGNETGLRAWYVPSGISVLIDKSGNDLNGTLYGSPNYTAINSLNINQEYAVKIKIKNALRTWKYINSGTADLLSITGETLDNLPESQSRTGTAFYQTATEKCFDILQTPEVWIKFDVYFDGSTRWRAYNDGISGAAGITAQVGNGLSFFANEVNVSPDGKNIANVCKPNQLQTVLLHMISGTTGTIEAWVDGEKIYSYTGNVNYGENFSDIYLQSDGAGTFFSNVIISNAEIDLSETLIKISADFDVIRDVRKALQLTFDVNRIVKGNINVILQADVVIKDQLALEKNIDVITQIRRNIDLAVDIAILDVISVVIEGDVRRVIVAKVNLYPTDSEEIFLVETTEPITIPADVKPKKDDDKSNIQSFEVYLAEQQITDTIKFAGIIPFEIMQQVRGQFLDYQYDFRVESIKKQGILYVCTCQTNMDEIFYTPLNYSLPSVTCTDWHKKDEGSYVIEDSTWKTKANADNIEFFIYPEASKHVEKIANGLGLIPIMQFKDFYSTVEFGEQEENGATYNDLIRDIFGWSSRIPTEMINVYIRAGKLFVIQRGYEAHLIDISGEKISVPIFSYDLVRMYYKRNRWSETKTRQKKTSRAAWRKHTVDPSAPSSGEDQSDEESNAEKESAWVNVGTVTVSDSSGVTTTTHYYTDNGILIRTIAVFESNSDASLNTTTTTINQYNDDNLISRTTVTVSHTDPLEDTRTVTTYGYITLPNGKKFLSTEQISEYSVHSLVYGFELDETRVTNKSPTGRGQGTDTDNKGNSNTGGNIGDDRSTPYQENQSPSSYGTETEYMDIEGLTLFDTSFPVQDISSEDFDGVDDEKGRGRLIELTEKIKWLNYKTQETVTLDLYECPHLIDFNDRILLFGNVYFLVSNVLSTAPRVYNQQHLTLVRWY